LEQTAIQACRLTGDYKINSPIVELAEGIILLEFIVLKLGFISYIKIIS